MEARPDVERLDGRTRRAVFRRGGTPLAYADTIALLRGDEGFRERLLALFGDAPFDALYWETPPVTRATAGRAFELVLVDAPALAGAPPDAAAFAEHFAADTDVVAFDNLGGDARLVAPCPRADPGVYAHLAAFARGAPEAQRHALLARVGAEVEARLSDRPLWLSTAGGGVAWLHVRLDARPKYYVHAPYRAA